MHEKDLKGMKQGMHKAKSGLIRVFLRESNDVIEDIAITGDFFLFPEDAIEHLESSLINVRIDKKTLLDRVKKVYEERGVKSPGLEEEDFIRAIINAAGKCN